MVGLLTYDELIVVKDFTITTDKEILFCGYTPIVIHKEEEWGEVKTIQFIKSISIIITIAIGNNDFLYNRLKYIKNHNNTNISFEYENGLYSFRHPVIKEEGLIYCNPRINDDIIYTRECLKKGLE